MEQKEKKNWKTVLTNRKDKTEWVFPTLAVGSFSGVVVEMTGLDEETGEGVGTVVIGNVDKPTGVLKRTWQLRSFTPVDGTIEKVEVAKKVKA